MDTIVQRLIDAQLIKKELIRDFEKVIRNRLGTDVNSTLLYTLYLLKFKELTGEDYPAFGAFIHFGDLKPEETEQKNINQELSDFLVQLNGCGILTTQQFARQLGKIRNNEYVHVLQLLMDAARQSADDERVHQKELHTIAKLLHKKAISSGERYERLLNDIQKKSIRNPIEIFQYCNKALVFELRTYPDEPELYLEKIHRATASLLPDLEFSNFTFQIAPEGGHPGLRIQFFNFIVSLTAQGRTYKHQSFYALKSTDKDKRLSCAIDHQEYYHIFNKILTDLHSPYRLHVVQSYSSGRVVDGNRFAIIALTKKQAKALHRYDSRFDVGPIYYENFKSDLTSQRIATAIRAYQDIGLLAHLSEEQIGRGIEKVARTHLYNINDVLLCFPQVVHSFEQELQNLDDPYAELLREYRCISRNEFYPQNISDGFDSRKDGAFSLSFELGGKLYQTSLQVQRDWIDRDFFQFIENVVVENKLAGKFYALYGDGQENFIYLTSQQYEYLRNNKLAVFEDEWESQEE